MSLQYQCSVMISKFFAIQKYSERKMLCFLVSLHHDKLHYCPVEFRRENKRKGTTVYCCCNVRDNRNYFLIFTKCNYKLLKYMAHLSLMDIKNVIVGNIAGV